MANDGAPLHSLAGVRNMAPMAAEQTVYQNGVPHTDKNGRRIMSYQPGRSFLPLVLYDAQLPCASSPDLKGQPCLPVGFNASLYAQANFTAVLPYSAYKMSRYFDGFAAAGLQVIREHPIVPDEIKAFGTHPNMLAWYLEEEPTGDYFNSTDPSQPQEHAKFSQYLELKARIKAIDPVHPVFVLDGSSDGETQLAVPTNSWWTRWNTHGDVTSHDQYPFDSRSLSMAEFNAKWPGGHGGALPQTVAQAVKINNESKPLWLCIQAFESGGWIMPTGRQVRGQAYAALIHGATGLIYFNMDSIVGRTGGVVGVAPSALSNMSYEGEVVPGYTGPDARTVASPSLLAESDALWRAISALNSELLELVPVLFAPTTNETYSVTIGGVYHVTPTPIRTLRKRLPDGRDYLLAVNIDRAVVGARFDVPGLGSGEIRLLFEHERTIPKAQRPSNSVFVDTFEAYGAHVYLLP